MVAFYGCIIQYFCIMFRYVSFRAQQQYKRKTYTQPFWAIDFNKNKQKQQYNPACMLCFVYAYYIYCVYTYILATECWSTTTTNFAIVTYNSTGCFTVCFTRWTWTAYTRVTVLASLNLFYIHLYIWCYIQCIVHIY